LQNIREHWPLVEDRWENQPMPTDKAAAHVDDADVERMINFLFGRSLNDKITAEERAEAAYQVALNWARLMNRTTRYAKELARRVRARALWLKAPTGIVVDLPE
jgi:hypothetical protein